MTIEVFDNVFAEDDAQIIHDTMSEKSFSWHYYHKSDKKDDIYHWHKLGGHNEKELLKNGFDWVIPMWHHIMYKCELDDIYGINTFRRIYFNAHTYGIEPLPHVDDGDFTMIYYPDMKWRKDWGGGTVIWNEDTTEIEKHVAYTGNRLMIFPAKRLHQALPINLDCYRLRTCMVFKVHLDAPDGRLEFYKNNEEAS
jgi:hypothetical protein